MRKLAIALLFVCGIASADEYWTAKSEGGGDIYLTKEKADACGKNLAVAYVIKPDQSIVYGCWAIVNDKIHVRYNDGHRVAYDFLGWERKSNP